MHESYNLSKSLFPKNLISKHWDIYPPSFREVLFDNEKLNNFRSNELSFKFNDSLEKTMESRTTRVLNRLKKITGRNFIEKNKEIFLGNPKTIYIDGDEYDYHDLFIIYFFHTLFPYLKEKGKKNKFYVAEIGGGYGGLIHRIKKSFPDAVCLLFDLPEQNYISNFYLKKLYPKGKFLNLETLMKIKREKSFENLALEKNDLEKFDFIILPGYLINTFESGFIDIFINTRSFMEMNINTVNFYFSHIHRMIIEDGIFYCVNRYKKKTSGDVVKFKEFPFDKKWKFEISQQSFFQPLIHEGLLRRINTENIKLKRMLSRLKPYDIEFLKSLI